ncbi:EthD family reductase [uncultured Amnibacterium sp.]|uniref:EthD family reductase n=1 Tax=uncultured Amnibacterium sp. TaxID=1631851 RepID=UPI0035CB735D
MHTKIELIVDNLDDNAAFDALLPDLLEKAKALPGLERLVSGKVWPKEDGTPTPAHRSLILWFADYDTASAATSSETGEAFFGAFFGGAGGKVTGLFTDVETVWEA